jgi:peroxiredoxin
MRSAKLGLWFLVAISCVAQAAFGQKESPAEPAAKAGADAKAEDVVRQMADYLGKLPAFSCKLEAVLHMESGGQKNDAVTTMTVRLQRPDKLAMIVDKGVMGLTVVNDGKELTQYLPMMQRYVVKPAPADFNEMTDIGAPNSLTILGMSGGVIPTSSDEFFKGIMDGVTKSEYLGEEKIGEVNCHHCRFVQEEFDWDIWVEVGNQPVPHKIVPDLTKQLPNVGNEKIKLSYVVSASDWNVSPKFTDADFKFTPPPGAEQGETLFEMPVEPPHPLLGQPAPAFTTTDVEGKPIDLKSSLGKKVVLLDFWATWCGPCIQALPEIDEVAKKYADKGLVFYAVNVGEDPATIKEFLTKTKLESTIAMSVDGTIPKLYNVEGIPQTVLIGKDGKVQVVHVGFSSQLGKTLTKQVEDLLAGKDLASEEIAKAEEARKKAERRAAQAKEQDSDADEKAAPQSN